MAGMRASRRLIVIALDVLAVGLAVLWAAIINFGRIAFRVWGVRISAGTPRGVLLWLGAIVFVRLVFGRRIGPFGMWSAQWREWIRSIDADPFLVRAPAGFWRRTAFASLGIAAGLAILLHDQIRQMYSVPDLGDPLFSMWRIGWVLHQIVIDPAHLFDANIFYPERLTLTLSDPMILPALTEAPLLALGVHPVVAYNLLLLFTLWFSGIATYWLVERLTGSPRAAFIAGLMYACCSFRFAHYSHLELQMTQWMPLGLLALHLFLTTSRWPYAIALGLAGVAQLYSSMYYAVFFLVYAAAVGIGLLIIHRPPIRPLVLPIVVSIAVAGVLTIPIARAFIAAQPSKGERPIGEIRYYSATPIDYLRAQRYSALWRNRMLPPAPERTLFPGVAPLALGAIGLAPPLGAMRLAYTAGLLVSFDGSLGLNGVLYPYLHRWLAPVRGIRAPARFAAIVGLTLSILAGFGARRALQWRRSLAWSHAVFAGMIAFVVIDAWPVLELTPVWKEPPAIYESLKGTGVILAEMPLEPDESANMPFMYFSLWHWSPMVNGYSGFIPKSYADLQKEISRFPDAESVAALRRRGVTHVTLNCGLNYPGCNELRSEMRFSPYLRLIADTEWQGRPMQLYEVAGS
jgi:hypothetical protein